MTEKDVHTEHCCAHHGCKYGDKDCPVVNKRKAQSFPCEECTALGEVPASVKRMAEQRLTNRLSRLNDLVRMGAPTFVIANEVLNLQDALWLGWPKAMSTAIQTKAVAKVRAAAGLCQTDTCGNQADDGLGGYCKGCMAEHEHDDNEQATKDRTWANATDQMRRR